MLRAGTAGWVCDLAAPSGRARLRWGAIPLPPTPTPPALKFHDVQCRYVCPPMPPYLPTRSGDRGGFDVIERGCGMRSAVSERWTGPLRCWDCVAVGVSPGLGVGGRYLSASAVPATRRSRSTSNAQIRSTSNADPQYQQRADQVSSNAEGLQAATRAVHVLHICISASGVLLGPGGRRCGLRPVPVAPVIEGRRCYWAFCSTMHWGQSSTCTPPGRVTSWWPRFS